MKYVLVSGGVVSGLGKGVTASSIGVILKNCGHRVTSVKIGVLSGSVRKCSDSRHCKLHGCMYQSVSTYSSLPAFADPYLNTDAGTMSPFEHGEVFVLDDGGEV